MHVTGISAFTSYQLYTLCVLAFEICFHSIQFYDHLPPTLEHGKEWNDHFAMHNNNDPAASAQTCMIGSQNKKS
jgi:hypothetical protein